MKFTRPIWIILKIFPVIKDPIESYLQVIRIKTNYLQKLIDIAQTDQYYFLYYTDAPEGPHFKFAFKSTEKFGQILDWRVNKLKTNGSIKYIEVIIEEHDDSKEEANKARIISQTINYDKVENLFKLKRDLNANSDYQILTEKGKHFVRNMLGLTYSEEAILVKND